MHVTNLFHLLIELHPHIPQITVLCYTEKYIHIYIYIYIAYVF